MIHNGRFQLPTICCDSGRTPEHKHVHTPTTPHPPQKNQTSESLRWQHASIYMHIADHFQKQSAIPTALCVNCCFDVPVYMTDQLAVLCMPS